MKVFIILALASMVCGRPQEVAKPVEILSSSVDVNPDGSYNFAFSSADGIKRNEAGVQKQLGEETGHTSSGSYSYTSPEGTLITVKFVADENGFQPQGAHLPVAPQPSPAIVRALEQIARTNAADAARAAHSKA